MILILGHQDGVASSRSASEGEADTRALFMSIRGFNRHAHRRPIPISAVPEDFSADFIQQAQRALGGEAILGAQLPRW